VVGHALFSPARIELQSGALDVGALGPVAVLPERQRGGVGSALIRAGLERCRALGLPAVIVLGHPEYYTRFGFRRADTWAIRCEFAAPPEAFLIAWSAPPANGPGTAKYHPAFAEV
jgi:putative acetyltransferase